MTQQTFPVGKKPRVAMAQVDGNLNMQTWQEQAISVETAGTDAQDYAVILRMVAEGHITPEEGVMLLAGLRD